VHYGYAMGSINFFRYEKRRDKENIKRKLSIKC